MSKRKIKRFYRTNVRDYIAIYLLLIIAGINIGIFLALYIL